MLRTAQLVVVSLFPVSEVALAIIKRADARSSRVEDRRSMRLLWLAIALGVIGAISFQWLPSARIGLPSGMVSVLALTLLLLGLVVRWTAIMTLGRLFTVDVAISESHELVQRGLYRYVRHPSYSGLLLAFLGLGLFFANWLSLLVLMIPITLAVTNRIVKEEEALLSALGPPYAAYCARTKRLIPGLL